MGTETETGSLGMTFGSKASASSLLAFRVILAEQHL